LLHRPWIGKENESEYKLERGVKGEGKDRQKPKRDRGDGRKMA
jgi:hypothetical protein